jgi:hypothetical protein
MRHLILVSMIFLTGCAASGTYSPPPNAHRLHNPQQPLFADDVAQITDTEISRILETSIELPASFRIGVVYLEHEREKDGHIYRLTRPSEMPLVSEAFVDLQANDRIYDISYLPKLLMPLEFSAGSIRAAAARYQADWVLIFETRTTVLTKTPLLGAHQARAYCAAECTVVDVRTGLIAFSAQSRVSLTEMKDDQEWSVKETTVLVEQEALEEAMALNMAKLLHYVEQGKG